MFCSSLKYFICIYKLKYFLRNFIKIIFNKNKSSDLVKVKESNWSMYCTASNISVSLTVEKVWMYCLLISGQIHQQSRAAPCLSTHSITNAPLYSSTALSDIYSFTYFKRTKTVLEQILRHKYLLNIYWINTNGIICAFEENALLYCIKGRSHRKVKLRCGLHRFTWNYT